MSLKAIIYRYLVILARLAVTVIFIARQFKDDVMFDLEKYVVHLQQLYENQTHHYMTYCKTQ